MTVEAATRAAMSLGAILAVTGGGILVVDRSSTRPIWASVLAQRWLTWAVLGPLWLVAAAWIPARVGLLSILAVASATEFVRLRPALVRADSWLLTALAASSIALVAVGVDPVIVVIAGALSGVVLPIVSQDVLNGPRRVSDFAFGFVAVVTPFTLLFVFADLTSGSSLFVLGLAVALSDVTAYVLGTAVGRQRLARRLSPNKTYAGLAGNVLGALLGLSIAAAAGIGPWSALWLGPIIGVTAVLGDLLLSMFKRSAGVKDAGKILPGFGGVLDRVDSLLLCAPVLFAFASVGWFG
ncbi:MAG: phosphatidate cytidylyltransferase [Acidimicrobiia bacterium]